MAAFTGGGGPHGYPVGSIGAQRQAAFHDGARYQHEQEIKKQQAGHDAFYSASHYVARGHGGWNSDYSPWGEGNDIHTAGSADEAKGMAHALHAKQRGRWHVFAGHPDRGGRHLGTVTWDKDDDVYSGQRFYKPGESQPHLA